jgi:hypothetical protein
MMNLASRVIAMSTTGCGDLKTETAMRRVCFRPRVDAGFLIGCVDRHRLHREISISSFGFRRARGRMLRRG